MNPQTEADLDAAFARLLAKSDDELACLIQEADGGVYGQCREDIFSPSKYVQLSLGLVWLEPGEHVFAQPSVAKIIAFAVDGLAANGPHHGPLEIAA